MKKLYFLFLTIIFFKPTGAQNIGKIFIDSTYLKTGHYSSGPTKDGNIIWTGHAFDTVINNARRFVIKMDSDGNYLNGFKTDSLAVSNFCNTPDSGYLFG